MRGSTIVAKLVFYRESHWDLTAFERITELSI